MRGTVVVEAPEDFEAWLGEQTTFAQSMARAGNGADGVLSLVSRAADAADAASAETTATQ
jgi:heme/copper-type cytochrome/quinol oxidase subunit 2